MIWNTDACSDLVYDNITRGDFGCLTDSDGHITCDEAPRPDCCWAPMHDFARIYSIICFVCFGLAIPCLCCAFCMMGISGYIGAISGPTGQQ